MAVVYDDLWKRQLSARFASRCDWSNNNGALPARQVVLAVEPEVPGHGEKDVDKERAGEVRSGVYASQGLLG